MASPYRVRQPQQPAPLCLWLLWLLIAPELLKAQKTGDVSFESGRALLEHTAPASSTPAPQAPLGTCLDISEPVCGVDGLSYASSCLAELQSVSISHKGYCAGAFFQFSPAAGGAGHGSGAVSHEAGSRSNLPRPLAVPKERAVAVAPLLSEAVVQAFAQQGFVYVGRAALSTHPDSRIASQVQRKQTRAQPERAPADRSSTSAKSSHSAARVLQLLPEGVAAVRFTPEGHVYIAREQQQQQMLHVQQQGATVRMPAANRSRETIDVPPMMPPAARADATVVAAASTAPQRGGHRRLSIMVGADDRASCPAKGAYPFSAIGQIDFSEAGMPYICSGALIARSRVLTAAHCVWDVDSGTFVDGLSFAPGRRRDHKSGQVINPHGVQQWSHATLLRNYVSSEETSGDVAVIALASPAPAAAGTLGLRGACSEAAANVTVTTAGYPSDKPEGECVTMKCNVSFACEAESTRHSCDTFMGQSGSSFWDDAFYIKGVHVRGLLDEGMNEFTTLGPRVLASIRDWELKLVSGSGSSGGGMPARQRRA